MLVLTRNVGEQIVIPECAVTVTVVSVQGKKVRVGVSAPTRIAVHREEVWRRICREDVALPTEVWSHVDTSVDCRGE